MTFPDPFAGLVIRYAYLWRDEYLSGQDEGVKDRPCAIILVTRLEEDKRRVLVLPVTHSPPNDPSLAIEIPAQTKRRIGLDESPSWVVLTESNNFIWPGPDLRPTERGNLESIIYGELPETFFNRVRDRFVELLTARKANSVTRSK